MKVVLAGDLDAAEWAAWRQALATALPEAEWLGADEGRRQGAGVLLARRAPDGRRYFTCSLVKCSSSAMMRVRTNCAWLNGMSGSCSVAWMV